MMGMTPTGAPVMRKLFPAIIVLVIAMVDPKAVSGDGR
jgi:hypothetical protein